MKSEDLAIGSEAYPDKLHIHGSFLTDLSLQVQHAAYPRLSSISFGKKSFFVAYNICQLPNIVQNVLFGELNEEQV